MCPYFSPFRDDLISRFLKRHRNVPNFKIHCSSKGCGTSFKTYDDFRMHCIRNHPDYLELEPNNADSQIEYDFDHGIADEDHDVHTCMVDMENDSKMADAQYLLRLRAGYNLSQAAVSDIILSTRSVFAERLHKVTQRLLQSLPPDVLHSVDEENVFKESLFDG